MNTVPTTPLPSGEAVPIMGQGTWFMGENGRARKQEADALRRGLDLGLTLIDTAEMYAEGGAEEVTGDAVTGRRDAAFLVSKVLPSNASRSGTVAACERSLKRLRTDRIDLYLLHWRGGVPLAETLQGFADLQAAGKIRYFGVSNFDTEDMQDLSALAGGQACASNQVLYNLSRRSIEFDLLPWCQARNMPIIAYSPIEQGRILGKKALVSVAKAHGATPAQVALAWLLRSQGVIVIPKSSSIAHLEDNRRALDLELTADDMAALDAAFPPARGKQPLDML